MRAFNFSDLSCLQPVTELIIKSKMRLYLYQLTYQNITQTIGHNHSLSEPGGYILHVIANNGCDTNLVFDVKDTLKNRI